MLKCLICEHGAHDGLPCKACVTKLANALQTIPDNWKDLQDAETRRVRFANSTGQRYGIHRDELPFNPRARETRDLAVVILTGWTRVLCEDANIDPPAPTIPAICEWLTSQIPRLRRHAAAPEIWEEIIGISKEIQRIIDRPIDREYLGECETDACKGKNSPVTTRPGSKVATCSRCKNETDAEKLRATRRENADSKLVTRKELTMVYPRSSVARWIKTGQLPMHGTVDGKPAYNLGDARTLHARDSNKQQPRRQRRNLTMPQPTPQGV